jgi:HK97 family phage prohead protease
MGKQDSTQTVIRKTFPAQVKKLADGQYEFIASTEEMDRDGEVIEARGWDLKNYLKNPVVLYAHDYRSLPIGKATSVKVKDGKLVSHIEFSPPDVNEFGDAVRRLVDWGALSAVSVGFIPKEWQDGKDDSKGKEPKRRYTKQELLEQSIVPVPSNPNALNQAREADVITAKEFTALTSAEIPKVEYYSVEPSDTSATSSTNWAVYYPKSMEIVSKPEPDVTENYIRIRVRNPGDFQEGSFRTVDISTAKGIKAVMGKIKGESSMTVQSYLFDKDKWSVEEARAWVEEHKPKSAADLLDELDYTLKILEDIGIPDEAKDKASEVVAILDKHLGKQRQQSGDSPAAIQPEQPRRITGDELKAMVQAAVRKHLNYALGKVE